MKFLSFRVPITKKVATTHGVYNQKIDYRVKLLPIIIMAGLLVSLVYSFTHFV